MWSWKWFVTESCILPSLRYNIMRNLRYITDSTRSLCRHVSDLDCDISIWKRSTFMPNPAKDFNIALDINFFQHFRTEKRRRQLITTIGRSMAQQKIKGRDLMSRFNHISGSTIALTWSFMIVIKQWGQKSSRYRKTHMYVFCCYVP